jgi:hypothetical protein
MNKLVQQLISAVRLSTLTPQPRVAKKEEGIQQLNGKYTFFYNELCRRSVIPCADLISG